MKTCSSTSLARPRVAPALQLSFTMRLQKVGLNPTLLAGLVLLALVVLAAIAAPLLTPYDPIAQNLGEAFKPPLSPEPYSRHRQFRPRHLEPHRLQHAARPPDRPVLGPVSVHLRQPDGHRHRATWVAGSTRCSCASWMS